MGGKKYFGLLLTGQDRPRLTSLRTAKRRFNTLFESARKRLNYIQPFRQATMLVASGRHARESTVPPSSGERVADEARQPQHRPQWTERQAHKSPMVIYEPGTLE